MGENLRILDAISQPSDIKLLTNDELNILAREIREQIVLTTSQTGGHVASSLGAVEIILAAHCMLDCPKDKLIFDVGHQAYAHKLITGRLQSFDTLRQYGGISGFPKPLESSYDVHPSGHASDSLSVALGLAKARDLRGGTEKIVAIIGDAAIAGGMAFEALNEIGQAQTPLVIILNDNEMSISRNVGALMKHFGALRASTKYRSARDDVQERMEESGPLANALLRLGRNIKDSMKAFFLPQSMIYEQLGIVCTAPVNGHNIPVLRDTLATALACNGPVLIHVVTRKGAGYAPALENPEHFHGVGAYDIATGKSVTSGAQNVPTSLNVLDSSESQSEACQETVRIAGASEADTADGSALAAGDKEAAGSVCTPDSPAEACCPRNFMDVFGETLIEEARENDDIVAMTAAMKSGTGLSEFAKEFPDRFLDCGITEEHVCAMASGIALGGKRPVVAIYSTFLQRGIDQIIIDNALCNLDVVFAIDRAGLVGNDGPTHHGMFDLTYMRMIPNMRVIAPSNEAELANALHTALALRGPFAIRYPRGKGNGTPVPSTREICEVGVSRLVVPCEKPQVTILAFGTRTDACVEAAQELKDAGIATRVVDMRWVKPVDAHAIERATVSQLIVTVEDGALFGGAGSAVLEELSNQGLQANVLRIGLPDSFVPQGSTDELMAELGLDVCGIVTAIKARLSA